MAREKGVKQVYVHAILDGGDTPPRSAEPSLQKITDHCASVGNAAIATVVGRFYAMDRDNRWDRVKKAYDAMTGTAAFTAATAVDALKAAYERDENDEFVSATQIGEEGRIADGDACRSSHHRLSSRGPSGCRGPWRKNGQRR